MSVNKIESTTIFLEPYFNSYTNNYYHIMTLNKIPSGPLKNYIKHISIKNISTKINKANENYCNYVISTRLLNTSANYINNEIQICTIENLTEVYEFLINNNYTINNELTNILRNNNSCTSDSCMINNKKLLFSINYKIEN